jgi:hypothetical protein
MSDRREFVSKNAAARQDWLPFRYGFFIVERSRPDA